VKLAIVTRKFWPYCGSTEMEVVDLAQVLRSAGHAVEIITVQWEKKWPKNFHLREIPVVRIGRSLGGAWGMFRFLRELKYHLTEAEIQGVIVYGLNDEAWGVIRSFVSQWPMVVRVHWREAERFFNRPVNLRHRTILQRTKKLIVDSEDTAGLLGSQFDSRLITMVPACGTPVGSELPHSPSQLRAFLADAHPILTVEPGQPLVICGSSLADPAINILLKAWKKTLRQFPKARLWILGNGKLGRGVWEAIVNHDLTDSIVMPGYFDNLDEVLRSADLYVHLISKGGDSYVLLKALSAGLPAISLPTPSMERFITQGIDGRFSSDRSPEALAEVMVELLASVEQRRQLGSNARKNSYRWNLSHWCSSFCEPLLEASVNNGLDRVGTSPESTSKLTQFTQSEFIRSDNQNSQPPQI